MSEDFPQQDDGHDEEAVSALDYWQYADAPSTVDWLEDLPGPWSARRDPDTSTTAGNGAEPSGVEDAYEQPDLQAQGACKLSTACPHLEKLLANLSV